MPGGKGMGAGPGPSGGPPAQAQRPERTLDDLLPPDPWRLWHDRLVAELPALALQPEQAGPFQVFLNELDTLQRLNGQRVQRATRQRSPVLSAVVDVSRDLRIESGDARDWMLALDDLDQRWQAAARLLNAKQRARVEAAYQVARQPPAEPRR